MRTRRSASEKDCVKDAMMKYQKLIIRSFILLAAAGIVIHVAYVFISVYLYGYKNDLVKADAVIVLGAAVDGDKPSPVFEERINHGVWLYQNGFANKLIFTGGIGAGDEVSEAAAAKAIAVSQGVPTNDVLIEEQSNITQGNLENAKRIMDDNGLSSALLVSDPLHMKRAIMIGNDIGLTLYPSPTPTTMYISWGSKFPFLCREVFFYIGYEIYTIFG